MRVHRVKTFSIVWRDWPVCRTGARWCCSSLRFRTIMIGRKTTDSTAVIWSTRYILSYTSHIERKWMSKGIVISDTHDPICRIRWLKFYLNKPIESLVLHLCRVEAWQDTDSCLIPSFPLPDPSYPMSECNSSNKCGIFVYSNNVRMASSVNMNSLIIQASQFCSNRHSTYFTVYYLFHVYSNTTSKLVHSNVF